MKPLHKEIYIGLALAFCLFILYIIWPAEVQAHDVINVNVDNSTHNTYAAGQAGSSGMGEIKTSMQDSISKATATAASMAFCQFDYSPAFQACAGTATYDDEWALNFQVGKRVDTMLITGGFACDDSFEECAAGGAVSWHF